MNSWELQKVEPLEHVCYFLSASSLIEDVQIQRHVLLGLLHQSNKHKIWKQPVDNLKEKQYQEALCDVLVSLPPSTHLQVDLSKGGSLLRLFFKLSKTIAAVFLYDFPDFLHLLY